MTCAVFIPAAGNTSQSTTAEYPCLLYLSGLTCTDENVCQKGSPFAHLFKHKVSFHILSLLNKNTIPGIHTLSYNRLHLLLLTHHQEELV